MKAKTKIPEEIFLKEELSAPCGLYCGACPTYLANVGVIDLELYAKERRMTIEEVTCLGCGSGKISKWCAVCQLRGCSRNGRLAAGINAGCEGCSAFPCEAYAAFRDDPRYPYHSDCPQNLAARRLKGTGAWLAEQNCRYTCSNCARRLSWWDKTCPECNAGV